MNKSELLQNLMEEKCPSRLYTTIAEVSEEDFGYLIRYFTSPYSLVNNSDKLWELEQLKHKRDELVSTLSETGYGRFEMSSRKQWEEELDAINAQISKLLEDE